MKSTSVENVPNFIVNRQEIFVGLEDSKKIWKLCVRCNGIIIHETGMPAKYEVLRNYFKNKYPECTINVIYEAGFRGFELHDQLKSDGWNCVVTPPNTVTEKKVQRQKNDRIDSRRLAKVLENDDYQRCFVPDKNMREDRQVSRLYGQMQKDINRTCNRIRRALEFHGFKAGRWSRHDYNVSKEKLEELDIALPLRFSFRKLYDELEHFWQLKKEILNELNKLAKSDRYRENVNLLKSVPGIGMQTAIRLILEWGDVNRFKRKEEFASFLGLIPGEYSSGEMEHRGHITKQGNRSVRGWLMESSWVAVRKDPALLNKFMRVFKHCGSRKKAIVAVARTLAIRIRAVLVKRELYIIGMA